MKKLFVKPGNANSFRISFRLYLNQMTYLKVLMISLTLLIVSSLLSSPTFALTIPSTETSNGSIGLQGTIPAPPPNQAATIATPVNGASFSQMPLNVSGLCPNNLLIKLFSNNVFIGSVNCNNGSYTIPVDLFSGQNDLVAIDYNALDQAGPDSNSVIVSFNDSQLAQFGSVVSLTSNYAERGSQPGSSLTWPFSLNGGVGPYAVSINWGDGSPTELLSEKFSGQFSVNHVYSKAGVYNVIVRASDNNHTQAFIEVVAIVSGAVVNLNQKSGNQNANLAANQKPQIIWWPIIALVPLIFITFWVGGRHQMYVLKKQFEKQRQELQNK